MNGSEEHPLFTWLKKRLPVPTDDGVHLMGDPKYIIWSPVRRQDLNYRHSIN